MAVDTAKHPEYSENLMVWKKIRDCVAGADAVKLAGEAYLPRPGGQNDTQYNAFKDRASFFPATTRTVEGYLGAIFRKEPEITLPEGAQYQRLLDNINLRGSPATSFIQDVTKEVVTVARDGILTEMTKEGQPYLVTYAAETIRNWRHRYVNGVPVLDQVILEEVYEDPSDDGFGSEPKKRFRVLELDENSTYFQRVFTRPNDSADYAEERIDIMVRGRRVTEIPFVFISPNSLDAGVAPSAIKALVDVNISHYQTQADLEHGCHWTALPTPWVSGLEDDDAKNRTFVVGSTAAWALPRNAQAGMLEFSGAGLQALERRAEAKEKQMAQLGARLLEDQKKAAETAESKRLQYSAENSILANIAITVGRGLQKALGWAVQWLGGDPSAVVVTLNTDFFDGEMDPARLTALVSAWQMGAISKYTMHWNMQRDELLPPGVTPEMEAAYIDMEGPALGADTLGGEEDTVGGGDTGNDTVPAAA